MSSLWCNLAQPAGSVPTFILSQSVLSSWNLYSVASQIRTKPVQDSSVIKVTTQLMEVRTARTRLVSAGLFQISVYDSQGCNFHSRSAGLETPRMQRPTQVQLLMNWHSH